MGRSRAGGRRLEVLLSPTCPPHPVMHTVDAYYQHEFVFSLHIYIRCVKCTLYQIHYLFKFVPVTVPLAFQHCPFVCSILHDQTDDGTLYCRLSCCKPALPDCSVVSQCPSSVTFSRHLLARPILRDIVVWVYYITLDQGWGTLITHVLIGIHSLDYGTVTDVVCPFAGLMLSHITAVCWQMIIGNSLVTQLSQTITFVLRLMFAVLRVPSGTQLLVCFYMILTFCIMQDKFWLSFSVVVNNLNPVNYSQRT